MRDELADRVELFGAASVVARSLSGDAMPTK
jgi:hypothetical protein